MPSIDERIVSIAFDNAKFEANVATTMRTLKTLETTLKNVGQTSGLHNIEADANKVTLRGPMRAIDILRSKLSFSNAPAGFGEIETASSKVTLTGANTALDKLKQKLGFPTAPQAFADLENSSSKVSFKPVSDAIDGISVKFGALQVAAIAAFGTIVSRATTAGVGLAKSVGLGPITQGFDEYATNLNSIQTILANTKASGADLDDVNAALQNLNTYSDQTIYNFGEMARNIGTFTAAGVDLDTATGSIKGIANLAALSGSNSQQAGTAMYQLSQAISSGRVSLQDWNSVVNAGMGGTVFQRALAQTADEMGTLGDKTVELKGKMKNVSIGGESFRESIQAKPGQQSWLTSDVLTKTLQQFTGDMTDAQLAAEGFSQEQINNIQEQAKTAKAAATEVKTLKGVMDVTREAIGSGWSQTFQLIFGNFTEAKKTFTDLANTIGDFVGTNADARNKILQDWKKLGGRTDLIESMKNIFTDLKAVIKPIREAFRDIFPRTTGKQLADLTERFRKFTENLKIDPATATALRRTFAGLFAVLHIGMDIIGNVVRLIGHLFGAAEDGSGSFLNFTGGIGDFLVALDKVLTAGGGVRTFFESLEAIIRVPLELVKGMATALGAMFSGADTGKMDGVTGAMENLEKKIGPLKRLLEDLGGAWDVVADKMDRLVQIATPIVSGILDEIGNIGELVSDEIDKINWDSALQALETGLVAGIFLKLKNVMKGGISFDIGGGGLKKLNDTMETLTDNLKAIQRAVQATTLLEIAIAVGLLAGAITVISNIDAKKLSTSMGAIAVGLGELIAAMALLGMASKGLPIIGMPIIAGSIVLLAGAVVLLAGALKVMSGMDWEEMARGLVGVGASIAILGLSTRIINPALTLAAAATLIPLAFGVGMLAGAVKIMASLSWENMAKGIIGIAGALAALAIGVNLMPASVTLIGPGLALTAVGLTLIAGAVVTFGSMDWEKMAQGIVGLAGALVAIGLSISLIPPTILAQAAGLVVLGVAMTGIAVAIALFGSMKFDTIVQGIGAMAGVLVVLAAGLTAMSGTLMGSVALLGAAAAFAVLAPALAIMGSLKLMTIVKALVVMAATLGVLAVVGALASTPLMALGVAIAVLGGGLLVVATAFYVFTAALANLGVQGPKSLAAVIAAVGAFILVLPKFVMSFLEGFLQIIEGVVTLAPRIVKGLAQILAIVFAFVTDQAPRLGEALTSLIEAAIMVAWQVAPKLVALGFHLLLSLLNGLRENIGPITTAVAETVVNFLNALTKEIPRIARAGIRLAKSLINAVRSELNGLVDVAFKAIIDFINGLANAIRNNQDALLDAGANLLDAIIDGFVEAAGRMAGPLRGAIEHLFGSLPKWARKILGIKSPSTVFAKIGEQTMLGLASGLDPTSTNAAMDASAQSVIDTAKKGFGRMPDLLDGVLDTDPVISPVLDLTNVQKDAKQLEDMTNVVPISAAASFDQAAVIAAQQAAVQAEKAAETTQPAQTVLNFEQHNTSPEALPDVEIYRRTNNQLALAKSALGL